MVFRLNLFFKELILFSSTLILGIFLASNYSPEAGGVMEPISVSWDYTIILLVFFVVVSLIFIKFRSFNRLFLNLFLVLVVFSGSQSVFETLFDFPFSFIAALAVIGLFIFRRNVLVHNIGMIFGLAGVSGVLGISLPPQTVIILLIILSFYDILAVYWTKHMVYMAKGMMESGAIFGFIIPFEFRDLFTGSREANSRIGENFMVLGSGDIALPSIMAASVAVSSVPQSLVVGFFSLAGLFTTHLIFMNQKERRPMAALPPIATLTIVGYLVSQLW